MASSVGVSDGTVVDMDLVFFAFGLFTAQPTKMRGVVVHVRRSEIFSSQVRNPVTELVVTRCDKAAPLIVKGLAYGKGSVAAVAVMREVWGL